MHLPRNLQPMFAAREDQMLFALVNRKIHISVMNLTLKRAFTQLHSLSVVNGDFTPGTQFHIF
jgi:hypothetical protein